MTGLQEPRQAVRVQEESAGEGEEPSQRSRPATAAAKQEPFQRSHSTAQKVDAQASAGLHSSAAQVSPSTMILTLQIQVHLEGTA